MPLFADDGDATDVTTNAFESRDIPIAVDVVVVVDVNAIDAIVNDTAAFSEIDCADCDISKSLT